MRALICNEYTGIDSLTVGELPEPEPTAGSVLVEVKAAAVNFADSLLVAGLYQMKPDLPFSPGSEVAGIVLDTGTVAGLAIGDRVCGFSGVGGMAEKALIPGPATVKVPDTVSFEEAASIPVAYGTSYHALVDRGLLQAGETLLVLGAAGGVGLAAVQIGKALRARVIAAVSSEEKAGVAIHSGADAVIRYDLVSLRDGINEATNGEGVDVVYDPVGGDATEAALRSTRWNGRLLVVGFAAGDIPSIPLNLTLVKGNSLVGVFWGRHFMEAPDEEAANFKQIMAWVADGTLKPSVQKTYPLDEGAAAIRWVAERNAIGRVVVQP
ncbi:MAG TPA: NADPH:quinone oxidoreductase family protein [Acidimicrobiia bacterium]